MTVRILHTADWQIGKGFGQIEGDSGAVLREQRFETVRRIAGLATECGVDAVVVAGDVFDAQDVSDRTLRRLVDQLRGYEGPWVLLPGNHDAALAESVWSRLRALHVLPPTVHLALIPEPIILCDGRIAILPAPLQRRHEAEDLTAVFDAQDTPEGAVRIGLAHGSVENRLPEGAGRHNPIAEDRVARARLDYLALGDWHGTLNIAERTWYAGTPEIDRFRGNDAGQALIVELAGPGRACEVERIDTSYFRWFRLEERLAAGGGLEALETRLGSLHAQPERCVVRLALAGSVSLDERNRLGGCLDAWQARFRYLAVDATALVTEADEDDLGAMRSSGFLGAAVEQLLRAHRDPDHPEQRYAMAALQRLYAEYAGGEGG